MSRVARKCSFGVHAPESPACVHVDTALYTSLLILDCESLENFQSVPSLALLRSVYQESNRPRLSCVQAGIPSQFYHSMGHYNY